MRALLPGLAVLALTLAACGGPSADEFRQRDLQGNTACIHFASGYTDGDSATGRTNLGKAAEHGAASSTEAIRNAVSTDASGAPVISDMDAFKAVCEAQGMTFK